MNPNDVPAGETTPAASPLPSIRFPVQPYQPDGGFSGAGAALVIGLSLLSGAVLGFAASFISQFIYLIFVFPVAIGLGLGFAGSFGINLGKVRNPAVCGLIGFVGGCVAMVSIHYFDYQRALDDPQTPREFVSRGFSGYVDKMAEVGVTVTFGRGGNKGGGINLGYVGSYIYWIVEILVVAGIAFAIMNSSAAEPFCTRCNSWKTENAAGTLSVPPGTVVEILGSGEIGRLAEQPAVPIEGTVNVKIARCHTCGPEVPIDVKVEHVTKNSKGNDETNVLTHLSYPGEVTEVFDAVFFHLQINAAANAEAPSKPEA